MSCLASIGPIFNVNVGLGQLYFPAVTKSSQSHMETIHLLTDTCDLLRVTRFTSIHLHVLDCERCRARETVHTDIVKPQPSCQREAQRHRVKPGGILFFSSCRTQCAADI